MSSVILKSSARIVAVMFVISALAASCSASANSLLTAKQLEVVITEIHILNWNESRLNLKAVFRIDNQNAFDINISAIRYKMHVFDALVAKDYWEGDLVLKANVVSQMTTMPVSLDMVQLFSVAPEAIVNNQIQYKLTGAVGIKGFPLEIPFEHSDVMPLQAQ